VNMKGRIKVAIIGSRGIPARYGGFETFTEKIATELAERNIYVVVYCMKDLKREVFFHRNIKRVFMPTLRIPVFEKFLLSSFSLLHSIFVERTNVIIGISTTGGTLLWLPRVFRKKIILSFDGIEWARSRWNRIISFALKTLETLSVKFADVIIADSEAIAGYIKSCYNKKSTYIPYGSEDCKFTESDWQEVKHKYGLSSKSYYLVVGRFVPENNFEMIINGIIHSNTVKKLVIVSDVVPLDVLKCCSNGRILFTGPIYERGKLFALRKNAFAHIHGHSVGGTNPSLLEAIASENLILCYDVPFNREVLCEHGYYFKDKDELKNLIEYIEKNHQKLNLMQKKQYYKKILNNKYNWTVVADKYFYLINKIVNSG